MTNLNILFAAKGGRPITGNETKAIDLALSKANSSDIPDDQVENVLKYLDSNLLHNKDAIPASQFIALEELRSTLEARH